jgi:hypothetical protein
MRFSPGDLLRNIDQPSFLAVVLSSRFHFDDFYFIYLVIDKKVVEHSAAFIEMFYEKVK